MITQLPISHRLVEFIFVKKKQIVWQSNDISSTAYFLLLSF